MTERENTSVEQSRWMLFDWGDMSRRDDVQCPPYSIHDV